MVNTTIPLYDNHNPSRRQSQALTPNYLDLAE